MWLQQWRLYEPKQHNDHSRPLRVVIDVNVLVSGTIVPRDNSAFIVRSFKQGIFDIITSRQHLNDMKISMTTQRCYVFWRSVV
jgi:hypothetical protein